MLRSSGAFGRDRVISDDVVVQVTVANDLGISVTCDGPASELEELKRIGSEIASSVATVASAL
jgi:hypothetical protein